jgi:hypothetical protein
MTTIAYRAGVIAADTLTTSGKDVVGYAVKVGGRNGVLWAASGDAAWGKRFRDWMAGGMPGDCPAPPNEMTGGFAVLPDDSVVCFHANGCERRTGLPFWADGSGADYALGAMQAGADARGAVEAALRWDRNSGGEITVLRRGG